MKVYIFRHAIAMDRQEFSRQNKDDFLRPLTATGRGQFLFTCQMIKKVVEKFDRIYTSPLTRAQQSCEILSSQIPGDTETIELLVPEADPRKLLQLIKSHNSIEALAIVGHEPQLSNFISLACFGDYEHPIHIKKGGVCVLKWGKSGGKNLEIAELISARFLHGICNQD